MATTWLVFNRLDKELNSITFQTISGELRVSRDGDQYCLDFPSRPARKTDQPSGLTAALGVEPVDFLRAAKNMAVFETEEQVLAIKPDFAYIAGLDGDGLVITAPGNDCDCVSRYFAPHVGISEDPVTGSAHCTVVPYWTDRLGKSKLHARQVSARGGELFCEIKGDRVFMSGQAVLFMEGKIYTA